MSNNDQFAARAVYAGLRRMTDDRQVIKSAFSFWKSTLSNQEFDVVTIVTALVEYLDLSSQEKKTLMIALHASSNRLVDELAPVPGIISGDAGGADESLEPAPAQTKPTGAVAPHLQVTQRYMQLFAQYMRRINSGEFTDFRQEVASKGLDGISPSLESVIKSWASNGMAELKLPSGSSEDDCKTLCHEMYMLASEFIGPNPSDDVVVKSINDCLDLEAASRFNPRDLVN